MSTPPGGFESKREPRALPGGIWALGFVSLFMDTSSELVHSLLPVFLVGVLGASMTTIGLLEGLAEAATAITKVFSGSLSDRLGRRKPLAFAGYFLAALTKPIFPMATTVGWVFAARFVDRVGKGIRGAPRDALVADLTPLELRGAAFGLRQSLDSVGAFAGPLAAVACMAWFANDLRAVLWVGVVPAFVAVAVLAFAVREPAGRRQVISGGRPMLLWGEIRELPGGFWHVVLVGGVFTLARFSEAFLVLRAREVGLALGQIPLVLVVMNVVYAATAYPAGLASDRFRARNVLLAGLVVLVVADGVLIAAATPFGAFAGAALWGLHMGLTQGLFARLVADAAPEGLRGTAFGVFHLASGLALFTASAVAGLLWEAYGAPAAFGAGAVFAALAACGMLAHRLRS